MLDYKIYIEQILEMINLLKNSDLEKLDKDRQLFDATAMRIQVVGEAIRKIPASVKKKHKEINWDSLTKTRDFVSHHYELLDYEIMKAFILKKLLPLEEEFKKILKEKNEL